jgi:hypothetical protein
LKKGWQGSRGYLRRLLILLPEYGTRRLVGFTLEIGRADLNFPGVFNFTSRGLAGKDHTWRVRIPRLGAAVIRWLARITLGG